MKNSKEMMQALIKGETLINEDNDEIYLINGTLFVGLFQSNYSQFTRPENWKIKQPEPEWYEKENAVGTLCEFWDYDHTRKIIDTFTTTGICNGELSFMPGDTYLSGMYKNARQLTKAEVQIFKDKAPEFTTNEFE